MESSLLAFTRLRCSGSFSQAAVVCWLQLSSDAGRSGAEGTVPSQVGPGNKDQLDEVLNHFSIEADNPAVCMSQVWREFQP